MPNPSQADTTNVDKSRPPQDDGPHSSATISIAHAVSGEADRRAA
jgi:hypothetical protein